LKQATETISNQTSWRQTYSFDRYGNRRFDLSQTTTPDSQSNQNITNPQIDTSNNRFLQSQGYFYDAAGNLTQDASGKRYFYDADNKQTKFYQVGNQNDNNPDAIYSYDGGGQRVKKAVGNETTIFVYDASGKMVAEYTINAPANTNPQISYLTSDMLGSPRILTNASGNVISRRDFMPFGEEIIGIGQRSGELGYNDDDIRKKFTGQIRDTESRLDYFNARYYSSAYGRFTSPDEFSGGPEELFDFASKATSNPTFYADLTNPQSLNKYQYTYNNPVCMVDPDGHFPWLIVAGVVYVILTSADYANAPGPRDHTYPSQGQGLVLQSAVLGAAGGYAGHLIGKGVGMLVRTVEVVLKFATQKCLSFYSFHFFVVKNFS
jgi:RHS repeat-associated protein